MMGGISVIVMGLILMLPLLVHLRMLVTRPRKLLTTLRRYLTARVHGVRRSGRNLVQHHPKPPYLLNFNSESRMALLCPPRIILSSPAVACVASVDEYEGFVKRTVPLARHSSSFVATQIVLPVVDITCNYNSHRYEILRRSLRKQYGVNYPPGEVVLNYIQLSTPDSRTKINADAHEDLLDFFQPNCNGTCPLASTKFETEYLNPLDHFTSRQYGGTLITGEFTETSDEVSSRDHQTCCQFSTRTLLVPGKGI